jgi:hypothetical protein
MAVLHQFVSLCIAIGYTDTVLCEHVAAAVRRWLVQLWHVCTYPLIDNICKYQALTQFSMCRNVI